MMVCTDPLPNERVPTNVARLWSCSAPATISEADAEPPLIKTISCLPLVRSPGCAERRWVSSALRPRVETISPRSRKASETVTASSSNPPGLLRRSRSEEHTSELQSQSNLVCRLLLEKKKKNHNPQLYTIKKKKKQTVDK